LAPRLAPLLWQAVRVTASDEVQERERRQLAQMVDRLDRFRSGELGIGPVINDLLALLHELHVVDEQWRDGVWDALADLEIPYAVALDRQAPLPTASDSTVAEGVERLDLLVRSRLAAL
jgi:hypothetical protein